MPEPIRLSGVTSNAPDAIALARFHALITCGVARGNGRTTSPGGFGPGEPEPRLITATDGVAHRAARTRWHGSA